MAVNAVLPFGLGFKSLIRTGATSPGDLLSIQPVSMSRMALSVEVFGNATSTEQHRHLVCLQAGNLPANEPELGLQLEQQLWSSQLNKAGSTGNRISGTTLSSPW